MSAYRFGFRISLISMYLMICTKRRNVLPRTPLRRPLPAGLCLFVAQVELPPHETTGRLFRGSSLGPRPSTGRDIRTVAVKFLLLDVAEV